MPKKQTQPKRAKAATAPRSAAVRNLVRKRQAPGFELPFGSKEWVDEQIRGMDQFTSTLLRSKKKTLAFLIRAGLVEKDGKRLAKPYR